MYVGQLLVYNLSRMVGGLVSVYSFMRWFDEVDAAPRSRKWQVQEGLTRPMTFTLPTQASTNPSIDSPRTVDLASGKLTGTRLPVVIDTGQNSGTASCKLRRRSSPSNRCWDALVKRDAKRPCGPTPRLLKHRSLSSLFQEQKPFTGQAC